MTKRKDSNDSTTTPTKEDLPPNVLQMPKPKEATRCSCPGCSDNTSCYDDLDDEDYPDDHDDCNACSAEPVLDLTERLLDMLAALAQYRRGATNPVAPELLATEVGLLRLLGVAAADLNDVRVGFQDADGSEED